MYNDVHVVVNEKFQNCKLNKVPLVCTFSTLPVAIFVVPFLSLSFYLSFSLSYFIFYTLPQENYVLLVIFVCRYLYFQNIIVNASQLSWLFVSLFHSLCVFESFFRWLCPSNLHILNISFVTNFSHFSTIN